jgi:hypothetical protein
MDGMPKILIVVICSQDDLELATTAVDADEIHTVTVDVQRYLRVTKGHQQVSLRDTPMDPPLSS